MDEILLVRPDGDHPESVLMEVEDHEKLLDVIRALHPDRQQLLILKFVEHLSNAEVGQIMGRTEGAIKSLYHRTLLELREKYHIDLVGEINREFE